MQFCEQYGIPFPPHTTASLALWLDVSTRNSERPEGILKKCFGALRHLHDDKIPLDDPLIQKVKDGIIEHRTTKPMKSGEVFDIQPLIQWIKTNLSDPSEFKEMRKKMILLLTLATMARPKDLAILKRSSIKFVGNHFKMILLGAKNDYHRRSILKYVMPSSHPELCPVITMKKWLNLIDKSPEAPLFCWEDPKSRPLKSSSISGIITKVTKAAGMENQAKDFRTTMATRAAKAGMKPLQIMALGGWKNFQTVCSHYIQWNPSEEATDVLFGLKDLPVQRDVSNLIISEEGDSREEGGEEEPIQVIFEC
jgi:hypothetical protein